MNAKKPDNDTRNRWLLALLVPILVGGTAPWWLEYVKPVFNPTPTTTNTFKVLSVDHTSGLVGQFFNFDVSNLDGFFNNQTWEEAQITIKHERTGKTGTAIVWRGKAGGSVGDGHGRWNDGTQKPGFWLVDDLINFISTIELKP